MKHILVLAMVMVSSVAMAGDKSIAAKDLPVTPSKPTIAEIASTPNEVTRPVVLLKPEAAIDDAISAPPKNVAMDRTGEYSTESAGSERKIITQKKPAHTIKKPSEYRKKTARKKRRVYTKYKKQEAAEKDAVSAADEVISK